VVTLFPLGGKNSRRRCAGLSNLTVSTETFAVYVLLALSLEHRRLLHVKVPTQPDAAWTAQQIVEAIAVLTARVSWPAMAPCRCGR
jgi:alkylhydroperoxidase/carboxymuconolactone decarboxylase family protein YurZ